MPTATDQQEKVKSRTKSQRQRSHGKGGGRAPLSLSPSSLLSPHLRPCLPQSLRRPSRLLPLRGSEGGPWEGKHAGSIRQRRRPPADICKVHHPSCPRWPTTRSGRGGFRHGGLASKLIFTKSKTFMCFPIAIQNGFHKRYVTFCYPQSLYDSCTLMKFSAAPKKIIPSHYQISK